MGPGFYLANSKCMPSTVLCEILSFHVDFPVGMSTTTYYSTLASLLTTNTSTQAGVQEYYTIYRNVHSSNEQLKYLD